METTKKTVSATKSKTTSAKPKTTKAAVKSSTSATKPRTVKKSVKTTKPEEKKKILFVASEATPFIATG
ncbi:MAG: hypothetical protein OSJ68_09645, partial [Clostridia bacterium]|nr:hypothetical protein [Clostridia bacterium]